MTPADNRNDLVLGFRGSEDAGTGLSSGTSRVWTEFSTLASRFETLTGGDDLGAGCRGVSKVLARSTGVLPREIFGVCTERLPGTMVD